MSLPSAWIECDGGVCPAPAKATKNKGKDTSTVGKEEKPAENCKLPCICRLFSAPSGDVAGEENWSWENEPNSVYNQGTKKFKWICTKPNIELSGEVVCPAGSCELKLLSGGKVVRCKSEKEDCKDPCKCALFRLKIGLGHEADRDAKWQRVIKDIHEVEDNYVYACLCLRPKKDGE
jgi:hypothetical protein